MCVLGDPLLHLDAEPERIDTESDDGEKEPLDVIAEQLCAVTVEVELSAINFGVLRNPRFLDTYRPRERETESNHRQDDLQKGNADEAEKAA